MQIRKINQHGGDESHKHNLLTGNAKFKIKKENQEQRKHGHNLFFVIPFEMLNNDFAVLRDHGGIDVSKAYMKAIETHNGRQPLQGQGAFNGMQTHKRFDDSEKQNNAAKETDGILFSGQLEWTIKL